MRDISTKKLYMILDYNYFGYILDSRASKLIKCSRLLDIINSTINLFVT